MLRLFLRIAVRLWSSSTRSVEKSHRVPAAGPSETFWQCEAWYVRFSSKPRRFASLYHLERQPQRHRQPRKISVRHVYSDRDSHPGVRATGQVSGFCKQRSREYGGENAKRGRSGYSAGATRARGAVNSCVWASRVVRRSVTGRAARATGTWQRPSPVGSE